MGKSLVEARDLIEHRYRMHTATLR
jgi:hypothetical protein